MTEQLRWYINKTFSPDNNSIGQSMKCPFLEMLIFSSLNGICQFKNGIIGSFCVGLGATLSKEIWKTSI